jgi:hypothetical protein
MHNIPDLAARMEAAEFELLLSSTIQYIMLEDVGFMDTMWCITSSHHLVMSKVSE